MEKLPGKPEESDLPPPAAGVDDDFAERQRRGEWCGIRGVGAVKLEVFCGNVLHGYFKPHAALVEDIGGTPRPYPVTHKFAEDLVDKYLSLSEHHTKLSQDYKALLEEHVELMTEVLESEGVDVDEILAGLDE